METQIPRMHLSHNSIQNKVALITGGAVRVGRELALALAQDGYDIALHYNSSKTQALQTAEDISKLGVKCELFQCDLGDTAATKELIGNIVKIFPNLSLLVNSASIFEKCDFINTDLDILDRHMGINFKAPFILSQDFAVKCKNGAIINLLDTYVTCNMGAYFAYLLSKKSLFDLTKMMAKELAPKIRVNAICIGSLLASEHWTQDDIKRHTSALPLQQPPSIENITDTLLYLANSHYLTGQAIFVDSGQSIST